jgi:serine/threonine-protein kinase
MQRESFARVKALFDELSDLPEAEREARLAALDDDPVIVAEVRALLEQTSLGTQRIAQPVLQALARVAGDELNVGDRLGAWTLVGELGHGGMGTVYRAQRSDGHFEQIAAIKLLRGIPDTASLALLARERQILARLSHPNIARLIDGGATPAGQPYLVLEFIEGEPIDGYVRRLDLGTAAIVRLVLAVVDAVGFAHQRLVVHCDLKPSNILVGADGRPVLLDFGISQLLNEGAAGDDALARKAYTPGFASPEQRAGLALSTATDVYGLGRVLDELIDGDGAKAIVPAPLRAIVARATVDDPAQRYASVTALADDLRRWLDGRAVEAMGANRWYRAACYFRRNALALGLGAAALVALVAGLVGTLASLAEARAERARAEVAAARAERTAGFLGNLLSAVDPDRARNLDKTLIRELLDHAAADAQRELASEPAVLAQIENVIGTTYHQLGEYDKAQSHLTHALERVPADATRERLALREKLANVAGAQHRDADTAREYEAIWAERVKAFGPDDRDSLRSEQLAAYQWIVNGELRRAVDAAVALQPRLERVLGADDPTTLENRLTLGIARGELRELDQAEKILVDLIADYRRLSPDGSNGEFAAQNSLTIVYLRAQRWSDAEKLLRTMYPAARKFFGDDAFKTINVTALLASALRKGGKLAESGPYYKLALDRSSAVYGEDSVMTLNYSANYAAFQVENGEAAAALTRIDVALAKLEKALGAEHALLAETHRIRGRALAALGRKADARGAWQSALAIDRRVFGSDEHAQVVEDLAAIKGLE